MTQRAIAERFGVQWQAVQKIVNGKRWTHLEAVA